MFPTFILERMFFNAQCVSPAAYRLYWSTAWDR